MVIASREPTPNWSTVQVMGYGNTFSTFLLYLRRVWASLRVFVDYENDRGAKH